MQLEEQAQRGVDARKLMEHPLLVEALATIEQDIQAKWRDSPARDVEGREQLWTQLKLINRLRAEIFQIAEHGKVAEASLARRLKEAGASLLRS